MTERGDLREQLGLDGLAGDQQLERLDASGERRVGEVLAFRREEAGLLTVLARAEELPDEPELLVLARRDQAALLAPFSSAAFARSATSAKASGSDTAISASDFRSSSMPASRTPAMKRLYERP